jgi:hypothetical protein
LLPWLLFTREEFPPMDSSFSKLNSSSFITMFYYSTQCSMHTYNAGMHITMLKCHALLQVAGTAASKYISSSWENICCLWLNLVFHSWLNCQWSNEQSIFTKRYTYMLYVL